MHRRIKCEVIYARALRACARKRSLQKSIDNIIYMYILISVYIIYKIVSDSIGEINFYLKERGCYDNDSRF